MTHILSGNDLKVERDLSGGVKISLGGSAGVLPPGQVIELATVLLRLVGVNVEFNQGLPPPGSERRFLTD